MLTFRVAARLPLESRFGSRGGPGTFPLQARSSESNTAMHAGEGGGGGGGKGRGIIHRGEIIFTEMTTVFPSSADRLYS